MIIMHLPENWWNMDKVILPSKVIKITEAKYLTISKYMENLITMPFL